MIKTIKNFFKSFWTYDSDLRGYAFFRNHQNNTQIPISRLLELYQWYSFVCINVRSEFIAWLEKKLLWSSNRYDREKKHEYLDLITYDFLLDLNSYLDITWTAFIRKKMFGKRIDELEVLRSDFVKIKTNTNGYITWYEYNYNWNIVTYNTDEVFQINEFSPFKNGWGISSLSALGKQQATDEQILKWNWNFFLNNASSWTTLSTEQEIPREKKIQLIEHWKNEFMWANNAHKVALLDKWLKETEKRPGQKDMDFVEQRKMIRDEIFMIFKVSKVLVWLNEGVGYTDRTVAYENLARIFWKPRCRKIGQALNKHIFKWIGHFTFNNIVPVDINQLLEDYRTGTITLNEYRIKRNYQKLKNWNVLINGESVEYEEDNNKKENTSKVFEWVFEKALKNFNQDREMKYQKRWNEKILRTDKYEKKFNLIMTNIFSLQEKEILKVLEKYNKWVEEIKEDDLFVETAFLILYQKQFKKLFQDIISAEWKIAITEVGASNFSMINPEKWIWEGIKKFALVVDKTTKKEIIKIIKKGNNEGLGIPDINENIKSKFKKYSINRINTISRTEITNAVNYARLEAWEQSRVVEGKEWFTAQDERTCPYCNNMHWKTIWLKETFFKNWETIRVDNDSVTLDYWDINWPALHTSCRCDLIPIVN